jgi:hypothetical protein
LTYHSRNETRLAAPNKAEKTALMSCAMRDPQNKAENSALMNRAVRDPQNKAENPALMSRAMPRSAE